MTYIGEKYDSKVMADRQSSQMFWIKSFNNWIKAVLINKYCTIRNQEVRKALDLPPSFSQKHNNLLHVLDIGCGHGQDISKWSHNNVGYIVGIDVSQKALDTYIERWKGRSNVYDFTKIHMSAAKPQLYPLISHSYYDIVSAQLSLHYMFDSEATVRSMLGNVLQNLLDGGYMLLTIPDSCSIVKKVRANGQKVGDYWIHGNKYYSVRFKSLDFNKDDGSFGLQYGFYLKQSIGQQNPETKERTYWDEYLIQLCAFQRLLNEYGMQVIQSKNFLQFYKDNKLQHKDLFKRMNLIFDKDQSIDEQFWQIAHLYRVFVAKKIGGNGKFSYPYNNRMQDRKKVSQLKPVNNRGPNNFSQDRNRGNSFNNNRNYNNNYNSNYNNNNYNRRGDNGGHGQNRHYSNNSRRN